METCNISFRLKSLRERRNLSQDALAEQLGLKDRQSLSDIELGERKLTAEEMVRAANFFSVAIDYFTDPLELAGEGKFSWRQTNADRAALDSFEIKAGRWIAAYRHLSRLRGLPVNSALRRVALTAKSSFEAAAIEGAAIAQALHLGDVPALRLVNVLEDALDTLVLHVDTVPGVSGAACQLSQLNCILINRHESESRRNYDAAHEFFHLLTWSEMPPQHIEPDRPADVMDKQAKRVEQLAESFASGLLMPVATLAAWIARSPLPDEAGLPSWLTPAAEHLRVSRSALAWRLVNLGSISRAACERVLAKMPGRVASVATPAPPPRFSRRFVETLGWGIDEGHLSARRAALLLDTTLADLAALFTEHALAIPFDL